MTVDDPAFLAPAHDVQPHPSLLVSATTPVPRAQWIEVVGTDQDALPEQSPEWVDAVCDSGRYTDASRLYELSDGRRFVLPLVRRRGALGLGGHLHSPPAAWGFGGLVGAGLDADVVDAVTANLRGLGAVRVSIRPDPRHAAAWAHISGRGIIAVPRRAHVLDLREGADAIFSRFTKTTRANVRKSERRGVRVEVDHTGELLPVYYELFLTSVRRWAEQQHEPVALALWRARRRDPLDKLRAMARHLGDRFRVLIAYVDERPAAAEIVLLGPTARYTRGAMDRDLARTVRANDLLQWRSIGLAIDYGSRWYNLGESGQSENLATFKERFGAASLTYSEYRFERLPITQLDATARGLVKRAIRFKDA